MVDSVTTPVSPLSRWFAGVSLDGDHYESLINTLVRAAHLVAPDEPDDPSDADLVTQRRLMTELGPRFRPDFLAALHGLGGRLGVYADVQMTLDWLSTSPLLESLSDDPARLAHQLDRVTLLNFDATVATGEFTRVLTALGALLTELTELTACYVTVRDDGIEDPHRVLALVGLIDLVRSHLDPAAGTAWLPDEVVYGVLAGADPRVPSSPGAGNDR